MRGGKFLLRGLARQTPAGNFLPEDQEPAASYRSARGGSMASAFRRMCSQESVWEKG